MRAFSCLALLAAFTACGPDSAVYPAIVSWMEWPAEVPDATPFTVRLVVPRPGCYQGVFRPGVTADESAVTFAPFYIVKVHEPICQPFEERADIFYVALDTTSIVPALKTNVPRTFEMRASSVAFASQPGADGLPVRTYGDVTVRLADPDTSRRNGAGFATKMIDDSGCARLLVTGTLGPSGTSGSLLVLEDQVDTTTVNGDFVRGYLVEAPAPICGETRVFHLVSRN
ncbi:MAG: hypothetical protein ACREMI_03175 [Gemmatimonadales bacterium]